MLTVFWLSWYVVNVCDFLVGMAVLRVMSLVMTPPTVSMPRDRGHTSSSTMSFSASSSSPPKIPPCFDYRVINGDDEFVSRGGMVG